LTAANSSRSVSQQTNPIANAPPATNGIALGGGSVAIRSGIAFLVLLPDADQVPWISGTSRLRRPHPRRMVPLGDRLDQSVASARIMHHLG
jgi:hypothetical protein